MIFILNDYRFFLHNPMSFNRFILMNMLESTIQSISFHISSHSHTFRTVQQHRQVPPLITDKLSLLVNCRVKLTGTPREDCAGSTIPVLKLGGSTPSSGPFQLAACVLGTGQKFCVDSYTHAQMNIVTLSLLIIKKSHILYMPSFYTCFALYVQLLQRTFSLCPLIFNFWSSVFTYGSPSTRSKHQAHIQTYKQTNTVTQRRCLFARKMMPPSDACPAPIHDQSYLHLVCQPDNLRRGSLDGIPPQGIIEGFVCS